MNTQISVAHNGITLTCNRFNSGGMASAWVISAYNQAGVFLGHVHYFPRLVWVQGETPKLDVEAQKREVLKLVYRAFRIAATGIVFNADWFVILDMATNPNSKAVIDMMTGAVSERQPEPDKSFGTVTRFGSLVLNRAHNFGPEINAEMEIAFGKVVGHGE